MEITRAATPRDLASFLTSARIASVAWATDGEIAAAPAAFRHDAGRYLVGLPPGTLAEGQEVAVLIDGGPMYFDLRGVRIRGPLGPAEEKRGDGLQWFEVRPEREVAWHYGTLRER